VAEHYVYDPFPGHDDGEMRADARVYEQKYGNGTGIVSNVGLDGHSIHGYWSSHYKPLAKLKHDDVLLINAHGFPTRLAIAAKFSIGPNGGLLHPPQARALTADQLARHLEKDGLSHGHRTIRLLTCYGSGGAMEQDYRVTSPFSRALAMALGNLKYKHVTVSGYQGQISCSLKGKVYSVSKEPTTGTKVAFDHLGRML
jgi:hypothetical protein